MIVFDETLGTAAGVFFTICYFVSSMLLAKYLRENHKELWLELGQPELTTNTIPNMLNLMFFAFSQRHKDFVDPVLFRQVIIMRIFYCAAISCAVALLLFRDRYS